MRLLIFSVLSLFLSACSATGPQYELHNQHTEIELPQTYAFVGEAQTVTTAAMAPDNVIGAGQVSRYERQMIVPGGPGGEMSPSAQNFDGIMDYLEILMKPQIEENNRIAAQQAAAYPL